MKENVDAFYVWGRVMEIKMLPWWIRKREKLEKVVIEMMLLIVFSSTLKALAFDL
jgi:hypothetical protein